jgi:predicted Zn-dependent protease
MDRLAQLRQFVKDEPNDPFNRYALALEVLKADAEEARQLFEQLVGSFPQYLPTYYPYAQLLVERKETEKAEEIFNLGIERSRAAGDLKTLREIQALYNDWKYDMA